jgi:hypothetical protein
VRATAEGIYHECSDAILLVGVEESHLPHQGPSAPFVGGTTAQVFYPGILRCKNDHFIEFRHGSAAIFASGVSKPLVPLWSFMDRNNQSLFASAVLLNSNTIFSFSPRW